MRRLALLLLLAPLGCGAPGQTTMVPLLSAAGIPVTLTPGPGIPLEVVTRSTAVTDPLPIKGTSVSYGDIETALGHAISTAAVPWADAHRAQRPEGFQILVELTRAEAEHHDGRLKITLDVRATLQTRSSGTYIAQTQASCRQAGLAAPDRGAPIVYSCMTRLGSDLASWLGGVEP